MEVPSWRPELNLKSFKLTYLRIILWLLDACCPINNPEAFSVCIMIASLEWNLNINITFSLVYHGFLRRQSETFRRVYMSECRLLEFRCNVHISQWNRHHTLQVLAALFIVWPEKMDNESSRLHRQTHPWMKLVALRATESRGRTHALSNFDRRKSKHMNGFLCIHFRLGYKCCHIIIFY